MARGVFGVVYLLRSLVGMLRGFRYLSISLYHFFKIRNFGRSIVAFTMPIHVSPHQPMRYLNPTSDSRLAHRTRVDPPCDLH